MKKQTKGAVAAGGAAVLLLGGLGSLAYWSDSDHIAGDTITAGELSMGTITGSWKDQLNNNITTSSFRMVPGDTLTYTANVPITAYGTNLHAKVYADTAAVTGTLAPKVTTTIKSGATSISNSGNSNNAITVTVPSTSTGAQPPAPVDIPVTVTIALPFGSTVDNTSINTALDLTQIKIQVDQTAS